MTDFLTLYTTPVLSFLTVVLNIVTILVFVAVIFTKTNFSKAFIEKFGKHALGYGFVVGLGSFLGSIIYSSVINFEPCLLCWWERIFIYPVTIIFGIGMFIKEKSVWIYGTVFSVITIIISSYHTYLQLAGGESLLCSNAVVSCSKVYFLTYGYVTIPTMALSVGLFFLAISLLWRRYNIIK